VCDTDVHEESPVTIRKQLDLLRAKHDGEPVYVRGQVTAYNRKRLIEQKVPFIIPGNQLYLPMLAIDLREHFRRQRAELPVLSPATQVVLLHLLLNGHAGDWTAQDFVPQFGYTAMTLSRAFDELETTQLAHATATGRERHLRFAAPLRDTWDKAQPMLRSPVQRRMRIRPDVPLRGIRAGLTALAHYSMLAPPAQPAFALSREQWKELRDANHHVELPAGDLDGPELQVWSYPPALLAKDNVVDPLSLYLSLKDDPDERTQASLEEMMRTLRW
jgi:hypothetical protein